MRSFLSLLLAAGTAAAAETKTPVELGVASGWNSVTGTGPLFSIWLHSQFALHAGAGLGINGARVGASAEFDFTREKRTAFLLAGFGHTTGTGNCDDANAMACLAHIGGAYYHLRPVNIASVALGYRIRHFGDTSFSVGYAFRLFDNRIPADAPPPAFSDAMVPEFGRSGWDGGVIVQVTLGFDLKDLKN